MVKTNAELASLQWDCYAPATTAGGLGFTCTRADHAANCHDSIAITPPAVALEMGPV